MTTPRAPLGKEVATTTSGILEKDFASF